MAAVADSNSQSGGVAAYLRVSSDAQKQQGTIENQRTALERYFAVDAVKPYGWYEDEAVSGYAVPFALRPDGKRLLADVQAGRVSLIIVTKLDRLGRNAYEVLGAVRQIEAAGGRIFSLKENIDTSTNGGRLFLTILAGVAEFERDNILERSDAGLQRRLSGNDTGYMGGTAPYGYRVEGKRRDARLVIDDTLDSVSGYSEADVVRLCWHLLVEQDWATTRIALHLIEQGVPTRHGVPWTPETIRSMVTDMAYAGTRTYRRKDGATYELAMPAILTPEQVERARAVLASHRVTARTRQAGPDPFTLRGLLHCSECGDLYTTTRGRRPGERHPSDKGYKGNGEHEPGQGERRRFYVCSTRDMAGRHHRRMHPERFQSSCIGKSVDAQAAELKVWTQIAAWVARPGDALEELTAQRAERGADVDALRGQAERVQAERDALQGERNKLLTLHRKGIMTEADLTYQLAELSDEEATLRDQADAIAALSREANEDAEGLDQARALLQELRAELNDGPLTLERQRYVITMLVKEVRVITKPDGETPSKQPRYCAKLEVLYRFRKPVDTTPDALSLLTPWQQSPSRDGSGC
jgi:site-specific DNA recombinase